MADGNPQLFRVSHAHFMIESKFSPPHQATPDVIIGFTRHTSDSNAGDHRGHPQGVATEVQSRNFAAYQTVNDIKLLGLFALKRLTPLTRVPAEARPHNTVGGMARVCQRLSPPKLEYPKEYPHQ